MVIKNNLPIFLRVLSYSILAFTFIFLANNVLTIWFDWPGLKQLFAHYGLFGFKKLSTPLSGSVLNLCFIQLLFYFLSFIVVLIYVFKSINQTLETDAKILTNITAYIV